MSDQSAHKELISYVLAETKELDIAVYTVLVRRIVTELFLIPRCAFLESDTEFGTKGKLIKQLGLLIDILTEQQTDVHIVFVFVDSDNLSYSQQLKLLRKKIVSVQNFPHQRIVIGIAQRTIEAWLLADIKALQVVSSVQDIPVHTAGDVSAIREPRSKLKTVWTISGKKAPYPEFAKRLAAALDVQILKNRSKTFQQFLDDLDAALKLL